MRTSKTNQPSLFDSPADVAEPAGEMATADPPDMAARLFAVDPANDVVLEASAGTGKTRVLVERYVRLMQTGVDPRHVLAMTFTRKAASEMRDRVVAELRKRAADGTIPSSIWSGLRERILDIEISTIDAFCFSLLREFPLEADVDPAFEIADETEIARFIDEALDRTWRAVRPLLVEDETVRLLLARIKLPVLQRAIAQLIDRREVAVPAVAEFVKRQTDVRTSVEAARRFADRIQRTMLALTDRSSLLVDGPHASPEFGRLHADLSALSAWPADDPLRAQQLRRRLELHFLTRQGKPRQRLARAFTAAMFASPAARARHEAAVKKAAPAVAEAIDALDADVDGLLARGVLRVLMIAVDTYERLLQQHALLDFAGLLSRAVRLLANQEEFARSRLKLQARYHHLLIDEFQDTSRLQWRLIALLIDAWGEGEGAADAPTSIFVVGDRKQSIYRFRHAEVTLLDEAARKIGALRPARPVRKTISASYRAVPELLAFVNAMAEGMQGPPDLPERFRYDDSDRFPVGDVGPGARRDGLPVLGLVGEPGMRQCAQAIAVEIERLLAHEVIRDRQGSPRPVRPDDIAVLFRARTGHQFFEEAIEARGIRTYVYKGLGFFDAPEVQDLQALLRYLARPESDRRAAEWLRSRLLRLSDIALVRLAPSFARALNDEDVVPHMELDPDDAAMFARARAASRRWLSLADRLPPAELVDLVLRESVYVFELRGRRWQQARENVKKVRATVRRLANRGYTTLERLASYFDTLRAGDESNAVIEAAGAVNLMTIHAAKGLEFPVVFVANLHLPGRSRTGGFSVIERGPNDEPVVSFGPSAATALEDQRETEELRRLLYVAVTRARDRLYLAGDTDEGGLRSAPRSLASLLPVSLVAMFRTLATAEGGEVRWTPESGTFDFRVCRAPVTAPAATVDSHDAMPPSIPRIEPIESSGAAIRLPHELSDASRHTIAEPLATTDRIDVLDAEARREADGRDVRQRLLGTVVHRLLQRALDPSLDRQAIADLVPALVRPSEFVDVEDREGFARSAAALFMSIRQREDVAALLASGQCLYEVPVTFGLPERTGTLIRGIIDCVVIAPDGRATLLEFKTGIPRPEHRVQASLYASALRNVLGFEAIAVKIVYG